MDARLQRRVQRYGWDLAAEHYELSWRDPLAPAQQQLLRLAALSPGEEVLDVACGTGLVALPAAERVGPAGRVTGVDISDHMVREAQRRAALAGIAHATFHRMDAELLRLDDSSVDVVLCALGLMYMPEPERALAEMRRVLRPGGRIVLAVWGERAACGWSALLSIVDAEVESDVCPLFFRLGMREALAAACAAVGFIDVQTMRLDSPFVHATAEAALRAAFLAGPVALAWSRLDGAARKRVQARYLTSLEPFQKAGAYEVPGAFVLVSGRT